MYINDLEYAHAVLQQPSVLGGQLPPEILERILSKRAALKQNFESSSSELSLLSQSLSNATSARSRSTGGSFSRNRIVVPSGPDVTSVSIEAVAPTSGS